MTDAGQTFESKPWSLDFFQESWSHSGEHDVVSSDCVVQYCSIGRYFNYGAHISCELTAFDGFPILLPCLK